MIEISNKENKDRHKKVGWGYYDTLFQTENTNHQQNCGEPNSKTRNDSI